MVNFYSYLINVNNIISPRLIAEKGEGKGIFLLLGSANILGVMKWEPEKINPQLEEAEYETADAFLKRFDAEGRAEDQKAQGEISGTQG